MRAYGPPALPHPWPTVTVGAGAREYQEPQPRALVEQRRQINALAYLAGLEVDQAEEVAQD